PASQLYTLSLHDALPISSPSPIDWLRVPPDSSERQRASRRRDQAQRRCCRPAWSFLRKSREQVSHKPYCLQFFRCNLAVSWLSLDRKSTRLNSSHLVISY